MSLRFKTIVFSVTIIMFFLAGMISCNKDNEKSITRIKCVTCANGGSCINDTCRCPVGYEGVSCQTQSRQKFLGSWQVFERGSASGTHNPYQVSIQSNGSFYAINSIYIMWLYNYGLPSSPYIDGYVSGDSIFIPSQQIDTKTIIGRGYIHSNSSFGQFGSITMAYKVTDLVSGEVDDFGYSSSLDSPSIWNR